MGKGKSGMSSSETLISNRINNMKDYGGHGDKYNLIPMASDTDIQKSNQLYHEKNLDYSKYYKNKNVNIKDLRTRQVWVDSDKLQDMNKDLHGKISGLASKYDGGVRALEYNGNLIVIDGNHRINLAILKGQKQMKIRVCKVD